jgi:SAM-dependent methyltransferase
VEGIPEDPDERQAWLQRWAAEKHEELGDRDPLGARVRLRIATVLERQFHRRVDPLLDRRLHTYRNTMNPRGGHWVSSPSPWYILPRALRKVGASDSDVFVDFGCGTGRMIHQAAKRPLKRVIGVEVIPEVAARAQDLVAAERGRYRCQSVEIVTGDVAQFRVPDDLTIAYFGQVQYFSPEEMDAVLRNLIESIDRRPRRVRLIYYPAPNYENARVVDTGRFRLLPDISFGGVAIYENVTSAVAKAGGP